MEVILMQKVANLGNIGDKVKVKPATAAITCCLRARLRSPRPPT